MKPVCTREGCPLQGQEHPGCTSHTKGTAEERAARRGMPCGNPPMSGQLVCAQHGGMSVQARKAAKTRIADQKARAAVAKFGLPREITPTEALLEEVKWSAGHVAWLREQIATFDDGAGPLQLAPSGKALLDVYGEERDRLVRISKATLEAGVEERRVQLAEAQGALVAGAIRRILSRLHLTGEQEALVGVVVPTELRALAGGGES